MYTYYIIAIQTHIVDVRFSYEEVPKIKVSLTSLASVLQKWYYTQFALHNLIWSIKNRMVGWGIWGGYDGSIHRQPTALCWYETNNNDSDSAETVRHWNGSLNQPNGEYNYSLNVQSIILVMDEDSIPYLYQITHLLVVHIYCNFLPSAFCFLLWTDCAPLPMSLLVHVIIYSLIWVKRCRVLWQPKRQISGLLDFKIKINENLTREKHNVHRINHSFYTRYFKFLNRKTKMSKYENQNNCLKGRYAE